MELIVPDDKLSLAIGKKGQNVRLASQLTGWRIDIHAESRVREMEQVERQVLAGLDGSSEGLSSTLFRLGWRSVSDLAEARIEDLRNVPGVGGEAGAIRLKEAALGFVNEERRKRGEPPLSPSERPARSDLPSSGAARQEAPSRSAPPSRGPQNPLPGIDPDIVARLMDAGYTTLESMEEEDEERLAQAADLTLDEARDVKRRVTRLLTRGNR